MATQPTQAEIEAVQKVLYEHRRLQKLSDLSTTVARRMNLDPTQLIQLKDVRYPPGSGPQWFYPDTGGVDQNVIESAGFCDEIAATLLEIHGDLESVSFPSVDKAHLLTAVAEEAASWSARGRIWKTPNRPGDAKTSVAAISTHVKAAVTAAGHVTPYLRSKQDLNIK
jgi:hypothetical protein